MPPAPIPSERPALFDSPSDDVIAAALVVRARARLARLPDAAIADLLADTVFHERKRLEEERGDEAYAAAIELAANTLRDMRRTDMDLAIDALVATYGREIHNPFSPRTYKFATRIMPGVLTRLLTASKGRDLLFGDVDPASRMCVDGPLDRIRRMAETSTLILAPTHVSNLDSPLLGYALYAAGLPPFAYGAGLNLFSNPAMAFFMKRLGTYTVDRRKRNRLYKESLKDYSIEILRRRCHSLFFPGGTRSRSGRLERHLKKGLLGTGLAAWQENLAEGSAKPDVFIVPCTLSIGLVLEAETLIADSLAEEGKQRYIIMDDEFADSRQVASFVRRLMRLDAAVHVVFGDPMDIAGNRVDDNGTSLDPHGNPIDRRGYVCDRAGHVVRDEQRDHVYTERVAERLSEAYHRDFVVQPTHLAAWAAWEALRARHQGLDTWRLVRLHPGARVVDRAAVLANIDRAGKGTAHLRRVGPTTAEGVLDEAIARFASFHKKRAMEPVNGSLKLDGELVLYYRNRLDWIQA
ncbi:MAG: 1-acyl-sn-glycerol-3-phosphate acyltransferase [Pseudomonadota bacterium]|nr:1-acyl-sn-glycerol-3-phosphate acyltransferase [Pseudomonadota bacterium]